MAIVSIKFDFLTANGISFIIIELLPFFVVSILVFPLIKIEPFPVKYALLIPDFPTIIPPVGKSGPFTCLSKSSSDISGSSINLQQAFIISEGQCGGIFVAIPTAIPSEPFINKLGNSAGSNSGSKVVPS